MSKSRRSRVTAILALGSIAVLANLSAVSRLRKIAASLRARPRATRAAS